MFDSLTIHRTTLTPGLILAPMAGITTSAFRRLVADFGGYGALTTEMVSARAFLHEKPELSPFTKRRVEEGHVITQFRVSVEDDLEGVLAKFMGMGQGILDLNLGCPAPMIQAQASGVALFRDFKALAAVLTRIRSVYAGTLTVKMRLGDDPDAWRAPFLERLRLFEDMDVHAITVHPRFSGDKLKRRARWEHFPWIAEHTRLPVIGNGDVVCPDDVTRQWSHFEPLQGLMLGRIVAIRPWVFKAFAGQAPVDVDFAEVWDRLCRYTLEDMPPERAYPRMREFTLWYSRNFFFGHAFNKSIQKAKDIAEMRSIALTFLEARPRLVTTLTL